MQQLQVFSWVHGKATVEQNASLLPALSQHLAQEMDQERGVHPEEGPQEQELHQ